MFYCYNLDMIKSWRHKGLYNFFKTGSTKGIQAKHKDKLQKQLTLLNVVKCAGDIAIPSWRLHTLKGDHKEHYAITVSGNWRLTFKFEGEHVILLNYQEYH